MVSGGKHFNGLSVTAICARSITVAVSSRYSRIVALNDAFAFTRRDLGRLPPLCLHMTHCNIFSWRIRPARICGYMGSGCRTVRRCARVWWRRFQAMLWIVPPQRTLCCNTSPFPIMRLSCCGGSFPRTSHSAWCSSLPPCLSDCHDVATCD